MDRSRGAFRGPPLRGKPMDAALVCRSRSSSALTHPWPPPEEEEEEDEKEEEDEESMEWRLPPAWLSRSAA